MFSGDTQQFTRLHLGAIKNCGMDAREHKGQANLIAIVSDPRDRGD
jgi:hypothetical protein